MRAVGIRGMRKQTLRLPASLPAGDDLTGRHCSPKRASSIASSSTARRRRRSRSHLSAVPTQCRPSTLGLSRSCVRRRRLHRRHQDHRQCRWLRPGGRGGAESGRLPRSRKRGQNRLATPGRRMTRSAEGPDRAGTGKRFPPGNDMLGALAYGGTQSICDARRWRRHCDHTTSRQF